MADLDGMDMEKYKELGEYLKKFGLELKSIDRDYKHLTDEASRYLKSIRDSIELQKKLRSGVKGLVSTLKEINEIDKDIKSLEKEKLVVAKLLTTATKKEAKIYEEINHELGKQIAKLKLQKKLYEDNYRVVNKTAIILKDSAKLIGNLPQGIQKVYGKLKGSGLFEMDKVIKQSALSMGLVGKETTTFQNSMKSAALDAGLLGTSWEDLVKIQSQYSEALGKNVMLGKEGVSAINEIGKGTSLGVEAATQMAAEMADMGKSAESTRDFIQQTVQDSHSMGLNTTKVLKNIQSNIKLLNKYNFKNGIKGLAKMAETVSKLGVEMNDIAPMADKLWNVEGAVEMSAQLQVLGGKWAQLADPFKLMYQARNDMDGLTKSIGEAAAASASFAKDGSIQLSSLEMSRLKQVAEQTGIEYDKLVTAGRRAFQMAKAGAQIKYKLDPDVEEFVKNTAQFDENKRGFIMIDGKKKFLEELDASGNNLIKTQIAQKKTLKEQAEAAATFDEKLTGLINAMKVSLLPIVQVMNDKLAPKLEAFAKRFEKEKWGERLEKFASTIGGLISAIGGFIIDNPIKTAMIIGAAKISGFLFETANWFKNGIVLAEGFNVGTGKGGGFMSMISKMFGGGKGAASGGGVGGEAVAGTLAKSMSKWAKIGGIAAGVIETASEVMKNWDNKKMSTGEKTGRALIKGGSAGLGAWGGAAAGAAIGSVIPGIGNIAGGLIGLIGGALGAWGGSKVGDVVNEATYDDAVVKFNPKDKFMKVNDSTMIAGTNENGNQALAKSIMSTQMPVGQSMPSAIDLKLNDLNIRGAIELKMGGQTSEALGQQLLKDPLFIRDLSKMVHMATASALSGRLPQAPSK